MVHRAALLLLTTACATGQQAAPQLDLGSHEALSLAEEISYDQLFSVTGPVVGHGVDGLRTVRVHLDEAGMAHTRVQQTVDGVPVFGGEAIVHLTREGGLYAITDALVPDIAVDTTPDYTAEEAIDLAVELSAGGWDSLTADPVAALWVLRHDGRDHLAWQVRLHQMDGSAFEGMPVLFLDAHDGALVWSYDDLRSASCTGTTNYYGSVGFDCYYDSATAAYYTEDTTDLVGAYTWDQTTSGLYYLDSTSTAFATDTVTMNGVEGYYVAGQVHDYWRDVHGRDGLDGAGGPGGVTSHGYDFVAVTTSYSRNYANAYWDPTNEVIVLGDGDGRTLGPTSTLDIVGHEWGHGINQYEANFTYSGESGGLDESYADIAGAMAEGWVTGIGAETWDIGEDAYTPSTSGDALRYMDDPAADGISLDYYTSAASSTDPHYSSGIGNLAFYLGYAGGTHPRGKSTGAVVGIGDAAMDIWTDALTSYMTSSTNYAAARTATLNAAAALYGTSSTEYDTVGDAWTAVGVGGATSTCTVATETGSLSKKGRSAYEPSSSGVAVTVATQTLNLTGPSGSNFDLYLQKVSGRSWVTVASAKTSSTNESIAYTGTSGTYRAMVYSSSGTGSYTVSWCR
jgi:Zn-dependent metalloprotease